MKLSHIVNLVAGTAVAVVPMFFVGSASADTVTLIESGEKRVIGENVSFPEGTDVIQIVAKKLGVKPDQLAYSDQKSGFKGGDFNHVIKVKGSSQPGGGVAQASSPGQQGQSAGSMAPPTSGSQQAPTSQQGRAPGSNPEVKPDLLIIQTPQGGEKRMTAPSGTDHRQAVAEQLGYNPDRITWESGERTAPNSRYGYKARLTVN